MDAILSIVRENPWTVLFGLATTLYVAKGFLFPNNDNLPPLAPPTAKNRKVVKGDLTPGQLKEYNGTDSSLPILMAVNGRIFDVTPGHHFYGPGGPYGNFAGQDASRGLAKGSFDVDMLTPEGQPIDTLSDLNAEERESLLEWENHFMFKYDEIGRLIPTPATPPLATAAIATTTTTTAAAAAAAAENVVTDEKSEEKKEDEK